MMKRYILKQNHPYAPKGTVVTEKHRNVTCPTQVIYLRVDSINDIAIPLSVIDQWLEEVKEEPTCSKEFAEAIKKFTEESEKGGIMKMVGVDALYGFVDSHTSKPDPS